MDTENLPQNPVTETTAPRSVPNPRRTNRARPVEMILVAAAFAMAGAALALGTMARIERTPGEQQTIVTPSVSPSAPLHAFGAAEIEGTALSLVVDLTARQPNNEPASAELTAAIVVVRSILGLAGVQPEQIEVEGPHLGDEGTSSSWVTLIAPLPEGTDAEKAAGISAEAAKSVRELLPETVELAVSVSPRRAGGEESIDGALESALEVAVAKLAEREGVQPEQIEVLDQEVLWARSDDRSAGAAVQITAVIRELERTA